MTQELKTVIVAGDPLARSALSTICAAEPTLQIIGLSNPSTAAAYLADLAEESEIDLLIWDLGWDTADWSNSYFQELEIPILLLVSDPEQAPEAWTAGARAIVKRDSSGPLLAAAASAATQRLIVLEPDLAAALLPPPLDLEDDLQEILTPRELEVLQLLAEGLTNKAIAEQLAISSHTVKFHVNAILGKLNAQSRTEAVVRATRAGLLAL